MTLSPRALARQVRYALPRLGGAALPPPGLP